MKKLLITLMLCLSCVTCFANERAYEEAKRGAQFIGTVSKISGGMMIDTEEFSKLFTLMHELGYIPHHSLSLRGFKGETRTICITWIKTHWRKPDGM